jgi:hypothetical protein
MTIENLSAKDQDIVLRCMRTVASYIDDREKHPRLGIDAEELSQEIARSPNIDDRDENGNGFLAIHNCLNEICHGLRIAPEEWSNWFDTPTDEIVSTYRRWCALRGIRGGMR